MRTVREKSSTGIYHVMLRGVNKQVIFEQSGDYLKFVTLLQQSVEPKDYLGKLLPPKCCFYAYCLMPNHVHLVIQEKQESISETIQRIATAYALYYNRKYERCGHLFQDRFKSEPVNDEGYFLTLLRYVHQNPVAGGLCRRVEDYEWSSWREYIGRAQRGLTLLHPICSIKAVLKSIPLEELVGLVNEPLAKTAQILDFDKRRGSVTDDELLGFLHEKYGINNVPDLQNYSRERRNDILHDCKDFGATIRQLARLTELGEKVIRNA